MRFVEEIHEIMLDAGRVLLFQIPAALQGVPTGWKGHYYGRDGESLVALNAHEYEQIRGQAVQVGLLAEKTDRDLWDVIALDKVQKKQALSETEFRSLKSQNLVEGRRPSLHVSSDIAATTGAKAAYIRQRAFDKGHYKKMVLAYLEKFRSASRKDMDELLLDKLSDVLTKEQKKTFVSNLLQEMRREDRSIDSTGATRSARWILYNPNAKNGF